MQTPYDKYLDGAALGWGLTQEFPRSVIGEIVIREHPKAGINVIWRMVSDKAMEDKEQWRPLGYVETYAMGRFIANVPHFMAYCWEVVRHRTPSAPAVANETEPFTGDLMWREVNMAAWFSAPDLDRYGLTTLIDPRGLIPKRAFPMVVMGELLPEYTPTHMMFPEGGPERYVIRDASISLLVGRWYGVKMVYANPGALVEPDLTSVETYTNQLQDASLTPNSTDLRSIARRHIWMEERTATIHGKK